MKAARFHAYKGLLGLDFAASEINEATLRQLHKCWNAPLKWSTFWDMIIPFAGGLNDGWKAREALGYCAETAAIS